MSADIKPLFRPEAVRPKVRSFMLPPKALAARQKLMHWAKKFDTRQLDKLKETELLPAFLTQVFGELLGYTGPTDTAEAVYTMKIEPNIEVDSNRADALFGTFGSAEERPALVLEGKGPLDPLDKPFKSRSESAVRQCLSYARNLRLDWYVVTNMRETRIYSKQADERTYERFEIARVAQDDAEFRRFVYLLGAERVLGDGGRNHLDSLYAESKKIGRELTDEFYRHYKLLREDLFKALREHNTDRKPDELLTATQKILDRVLFVAFCEDRSLLPSNIIETAYQQKNPFRREPVWRNFVGLFEAVNSGDPPLNIEKYNGGLFKTDAYLDSLNVPDAICERFKKLAEWEFNPAGEGEGKLIDVEILGHIFEQSIADLEEMHRAIAANPDALSEKAGPTKRKKEGAFYTPDFVTRYIVEETLGPVIESRFERLRKEHQERAARNAKKLFNDPRAFDTAELSAAQTTALLAFWDAWFEELQTVRVVDPSCGSGAFLIEAFEKVRRAYELANGMRLTLGGHDLTRGFNNTILTKNLFGIDLNGEAVEIARLSCWIKTAVLGEELTTLDANILKGNSVVGGAYSPLEAWGRHFPAAMESGGFDAVIGNPPYVRQEWISADKPYLKQHYEAFDGVADLYVYFYELGLKVLKPGGRLGFIVTNKWMKAGYGENLRKLYAEKMWVEQVVDFGHAKQIFPDADVFPCILVAQKPKAAAPPENVQVCVIPREQLRIDDLSNQIEEKGINVPRTRLTAEPWNLEPPGVTNLMVKIKAGRTPMKDFIGTGPLRGILTGFNEAFLIDTETKNHLVQDDPKSELLIRPYLRGQDIDRWEPAWAGLWMIAMKSSANFDWPWKNLPDGEAEQAFKQSYPAIHSHFCKYRDQLNARQDQGEYWWELRSCAYWDAFDKPKITYQDITWSASFGLDTEGKLANNTIYFLPTNDAWTLATLNAPVSWWFMWRTSQHGKDEALRLFTDYLNAFPIPSPSPEQRDTVEASVSELLEITKQQRKLTRDVLDWLRFTFNITKPSKKLADVAALSEAEFLAEVKKNLPAKRHPSVAEVNELRGSYSGSVVPMLKLGRRALVLERTISDCVNEAYGLTPEEIELMWETAPPRMPQVSRIC